MKQSIITVALGVALLASCADGDMVQMTATQPASIASTDYLLSYDVLKSYAPFSVGIKLDKEALLGTGVDYRIAVSNFSEVMPSGVFSHGQTVKASGRVDTTTVMQVVEAAATAGMTVFASPMISNTSQNSTYLASRLEPTVIRPDGDDGGYAIKMTNTVLTASASDAQVSFTFARTPSVEPGIKYKLTFMVRGTAEGKVQCATYSNGRGSRFTPQFDVTTQWTKVSMTNSMASGITGLQSILFNVGQYLGTLYVDDIELYELDDWDEEATDNLAGLNSNLDDAETTAASVKIHTASDGLEDVGISALGEGYDPLATYVEKTADEKHAILTDEMTHYLGSVMGTAASGVTEWGVVENALDQSGEVATSGGSVLGSGQYYWADLMGGDYAAEAFRVAASSAPGSLLYICQDGMERNAALASALVAYVQRIESQGARVDGMGATIDVTTATADLDGIRQMLSTLAASGKMVKLTSVKVGLDETAEASDGRETRLTRQSEVYQSIVEAYMAEVPAAQRGGIVLAQLIDDADGSAALWSSSYDRKHAYGGVVKALSE